jgi:hypothetical protein
MAVYPGCPVCHGGGFVEHIFRGALAGKTECSYCDMWFGCFGYFLDKDSLHRK